jgi:hypothetical protein
MLSPFTLLISEQNSHRSRSCVQILLTAPPREALVVCGRASCMP